MSKTVLINIEVIGIKDSEETDLACLYINGFKGKKDYQTRYTKEFNLFEHEIRLNIINARIGDLTAERMKLIQGVILVFDIDKPESFKELQKRCSQNKSLFGRNIAVAIAANKGHLRSTPNSGQLVPIEQCKQLESEYRCDVFETSTETGENVDNLFNNVIEKVLHIEKLDKTNVEDIRECLIE